MVSWFILVNSIEIVKKIFSRSCSNGFTLIELLVVAGIISFMSVLMFTNYKAGEDQFALQTSVYKLAQDLRKSQAMSMSAREIWDSAQGKYIVPLGGYGVQFKVVAAPPFEKEYILFGDADGDYKYDETIDYLIELIEVGKGVFVKYPLQTSQGQKNKVQATYVPPEPRVYITPPGGGGAEWLEITLALERDASIVKTIRVNRAGLIEIK